MSIVAGMKKILLLLLAVEATLTIVGCQKELQPDPKKGYDFTIERLRDVGQAIPNLKITLSDCIPKSKMIYYG